MIAEKWYISTGTGVSRIGTLTSFDKALLDTGVGNYNLVRLSSILPAHCKKVLNVDLKEGSLLPVAYSTISSAVKDETVVSTIGVGLPEDEDQVGVIMEHSERGFSVREETALSVLENMIRDAFEARGWNLKEIVTASVSKRVREAGEVTTTFACIAEW